MGQRLVLCGKNLGAMNKQKGDERMKIIAGEGYSFDSKGDCFVCDVCGKTAEDEDEIRHHMQDSHGKCFLFTKP